MLESNERPRRDLRLLIEAIGQKQVERQLNVHRTTVLRWLHHGRIPGSQSLAVRRLLGDMEGTDGKWHGWRFHDGLLYSPAGDRYTTGDVLAIRLQQQRSKELDHELQAKSRLSGESLGE